MLRTFALALSVAFITIACGGDGSPSGPSGPSGTLNLRMTDSPYGSAKAVLVTFSEVAVRRGGDWVSLPLAGGSTRTCDLKKLQNSAQDLLGAGAISAGSYSAIRFTMQSARLYFDNSAVSSTPCAPSIAAPAGANFTMTMPSSQVTVDQGFEMASGATVTILVDFDGESSIRQTGTQAYEMTPVIRVLSVQ